MDLKRLWLFYFGCFCLSLAAQDHQPILYDDAEIIQQTITEEHLKSYKSSNEFDYNEQEVEENSLDRFVFWLKNILRKFWEAIFGVGSATGFLYFVFHILPYLILAFLLFLALRFFLKVNTSAHLAKVKAPGSVSLSEDEHIIKNEDIPELIKAAVNQHNYRLAIRYYYLLTLKILSANHLINWKPQKTNEDYIKEFSTSDLKHNFENATKIYEYVWYGEFTIDAEKFEHLKIQFDTLNNTIVKK